MTNPCTFSNDNTVLIGIDDDTSANIPDGVAIVGNYAFHDCFHL